MKKKVFIAPYNKPAKILAEILNKQDGTEVLFIDSFKDDNITVFAPETLHIQEIEKIIIVSSAYYQEIYQRLLDNKICKNKIYFYDSIERKYFSHLLSYKLFFNFQKFFHSFISFVSVFKLKKYKNKHLHEKCFIIGNGPSLTIKDLEKLEGYTAFASNKIYLAFEQTRWRPHYYFVEDHLVFVQNYQNILALKGVVKFFPQIALQWVPKIPHGIYYPLFYDFEDARFSADPSQKVYWGASVTTSMIQLAIYMGFKEIYLLGVDFNFISSDKKVFVGEHGVYLANGEQNHFHKEYRKKGEQWTVPDMEFQEAALAKIEEYAKQNKITIKNCSRNTKLKVFQLSSLESALRKDDE